MPRATCRCGQTISFPADGPDRVICPKCSARIRVRRPAPPPAEESAGSASDDGFVRFDCPCGRRLKVRAVIPVPKAGKCPDCGRVVPVPALAVESVKARARAGAGAPPPPSSSSSSGPETPTAELSADDLAALDRWAAAHRARTGPVPETVTTAAPALGRGGPPAADDLPPTEAEPRGPVAPAPTRVEAGLRVCPRCGRPVHLSAETCRQCGAPVPKR
jgi:hypothetical protein